MSGVGPKGRSATLSSEGDGETGSVILGISDRLVSAMVPPGQNKTKTILKSPTVGKRCSSYFYTGWISNKDTYIYTLICVLDLTLETIGPGSINANSTALEANGNTMEINLEGLARNNNGEIQVFLRPVTLHAHVLLITHIFTGPPTNLQLVLLSSRVEVIPV